MFMLLGDALREIPSIMLHLPSPIEGLVIIQVTTIESGN